MSKPHIRIIAGRPVEVPREESRMERARRVYGRPFGRDNWPAGQGPRYWTAERISVLAANNEERRLARKRKGS